VPAKHQRGEAALGGDLLDSAIAALKQFLRPAEPLAGQPLMRGGPGAGGEPAGERPRRHVDLGGQLSDGDRLGDMGKGPVVQGGQLAAAGTSVHQHRDELRLSALTVRGDH
jgi:hypothetical protein